MSDPKRYSIVADYQAPWAKMHEFSAGGWVKWEDYARLKAEVERLRSASFVTAVPVEEYEKLKAEVDRLTKSHSDALADFWAIHKGYFDLKAEVEQLRKEGKQP